MIGKPSKEELAAGRAYARWYIGHPDWADQIVSAMEKHAETMEYLRSEGAFE